MLTAITANATDLAPHGGTPDFLTSGQDLLTRLEAADAEQERLKAELKTATAQVVDLKKQLADWQSAASRMVKFTYQNRQEKWIEFGVRASK